MPVPTPEFAKVTCNQTINSCGSAKTGALFFREPETRADELALSGAFIDWRGVEASLRGAGYIEATDQLDRPHKREWLDGLCAQAVREKNSQRTIPG